jgi:hypothetical protein
MADEPKTPEWGKITAKYSNFFVVSATPGTVRIAFAEAFGAPEGAVFHTSIALNTADAEGLITSIQATMDKLKGQLPQPTFIMKEVAKDGS